MIIIVNVVTIIIDNISLTGLMQVLDLQHNSLASLPALPRLPTLRALILSHNLLRSVYNDDINPDDDKGKVMMIIIMLV